MMIAQPELSQVDTHAPLIKMSKIGRRFGSVTALEDVDFEVGYEEIIGLLGDNGAGKSTLIKILTGIHRPTSGQIYFEGQPVEMTSPEEARALGIETVYQDLALVPLMNISRNFYLGREPTKYVGPLEVLDKDMMDNKTAQALEHIGIHIRSAAEPVGTLSGGERQSIAIGRAVHFGSKLLILDEPTSALSIGETRKVISYTTEAKKRGLSVIFITHNIHHVFEVADRFTVISHGHKVGDFRKDEVTQDEIAAMIMGEPVPARLVDRVPVTVNTRPIEVRGTAVSADGTPQPTVSNMTVAQRSEFKRRNRIVVFAIIAAIYLLIGGAIVYYSLPKPATFVGLPPLVKADAGVGFAYMLPQSWRIDRSESQIKHALDSNTNFEMTATWGTPSQMKNALGFQILTSTPLSTIAKDINDNDIFGRNYKLPGTDIKISGLPGYRFEWTNPAAKTAGVDYIAFEQTGVFFRVTIDGPAATWDSDLKPLADEIIGSVTFQ
ncbi:MAG: ATP-binding cassette domain-containing protein [Aggregatilineales bacterium]